MRVRIPSHAPSGSIPSGYEPVERLTDAWGFESLLPGFRRYNATTSA